LGFLKFDELLQSSFRAPPVYLIVGEAKMNFFEDHGLPLVQLKERRRELIVALIGRKEHPISKDKIAEIASIQHAIAAMEAVIGDLDAGHISVFASAQQIRPWLVA
jgi:hypothetical protein